MKECLEKRFDRVQLPKQFLALSIREGKGITSLPWNSDISDDTNEAASSIMEGEESGVFM